MAKTEKIGGANSGEGGAGLSAGHRRSGESSYKELWLAVRTELDDLRIKYEALLSKLDADAGVTDLDYASTSGLDTKTFEK